MATALADDHISGSTEPWVQQLIVALLIAQQRPKPVVLECGGFLGHTSVKLAKALGEMGGGTLIVAEYDPEAPERADAVAAALADAPATVTVSVRREDALAVIASLLDESCDFAFLDDDHSHEHVAAELRALWPKMRTGGIICGHDVFGSCDLRQEFEAVGGYALDLPKLGTAGGLGIVQVR